MNNPDTEIKRWGIVMIQSLQVYDRNTGEELYHDILQYKRYYQSGAFSLFYNVASLEDLKLAIQNVLENIQDGDIVTLHFETHGHEEGIALSNGEIVSWRVFYDLIRPINIQIGHLLFVVMSMCKSIAMISSLNPEARAPYRAFICTVRDVTQDEIIRGFQVFYEKYFYLLDIFQAYKALEEETSVNGISPFQILIAEDVFNETFNPNRNINSLVIEQLKSLNITINEDSKREMSDTIRKILKEIYDRHQEFYNFRDIY